MTDSPWLILAAAIQKLTDRVDALPSIREATVTATSPLSVRFDTDDTAVEVYGSLSPQVTVGDRVLTVRVARYVWMLGRRGGAPFAIAAGTFIVPAVGSGEVHSGTVTFPAGKFTQPPVLTSGQGQTRWGVSFHSVTETGFSYDVANWTSGAAIAAPLRWIAVQMTPGGSSG